MQTMRHRSRSNYEEAFHPHRLRTQRIIAAASHSLPSAAEQPILYAIDSARGLWKASEKAGYVLSSVFPCPSATLDESCCGGRDPFRGLERTCP